MSLRTLVQILKDGFRCYITTFPVARLTTDFRLLFSTCIVVNDRYCIVSMSCVINKNLIEMQMFDLR